MTPRALSSVLATLGTLQLRALGLLICIDFMDSLSNYYSDGIYLFHYLSQFLHLLRE